MIEPSATVAPSVRETAAVKVWTIVVAAGSGERFGAAKQFELIPAPDVRAEVERIVDRSVRLASRHSDGVVVVLPAGFVWDGPDVAVAVDGGATRSASVRNGLAEIPDDVEVVLVHDAARPMADDGVWQRVIEAVRAGSPAVVPAVPIADTLKRVDGNTVVATVDRSDLVAIQTPQGFRLDVLRAAHAGNGEHTDDAGLVEMMGERVVTVVGDTRNLKVTTPEDLERVRWMLEATTHQGAS